MLALHPTDLPLDRFPEYQDPLEEEFPPFSDVFGTMTANGTAPANKALGVDTDDASRHPSPQPTHFNLPTGNGASGNKILRSATVGYIAPEFKGRTEQMTSGKPHNASPPRHTAAFSPFSHFLLPS